MEMERGGERRNLYLGFGEFVRSVVDEYRVE
jgi:hypothetical protein